MQRLIVTRNKIKKVIIMGKQIHIDAVKQKPGRERVYKTNAARQKAYRKRHYNEQPELRMRISSTSKYNLSVLARHRNMTESELTERLINKCYMSTVDKMTDAEFDEFNKL